MIIGASGVRLRQVNTLMPETKLAPETRRASRDRRREPRFPSKGLADLVVLYPPKFQRLTAMVVDISRSGFQIDLDEPIEDGGRIEIRLKENIVSGVVKNCRQIKGGRGYRLWIETIEGTASPLRTRHLLEGDVQPYARGVRLSATQRAP